MHIRKSCAELTAEDFQHFPAWEFADDEEGIEGQDETTVRPLSADNDGADGGLIVAAEARLADGSVHPAYLTSRPAGAYWDLGDVQPVILTPRRQVAVWRGVVGPSAEELRDQYVLLDARTLAEVFPIRFASTAPLDGDSVSVEAPGFMVLEDWKSGRVRVVV